MIIAFRTSSVAIMAEQFLKNNQISVTLIPTPSSFGIGCGFSLDIPRNIGKCMELLENDAYLSEMMVIK